MQRAESQRWRFPKAFGLKLRTQFSIIALIALMLTTGAAVVSEQRSTGALPPLEQTDVIEGLRSGDTDTRARIARRLHRQRQQIISALCRVIVGGVVRPKEELAVKKAMQLLGNYRAIEAVPVLVDNISFTFGSMGQPIRGGTYADMPAVRALIEIGLPSLDALVTRVRETDDEVVRQRAAIVINQVLGTDMALFLAKDRRDREKDDAARQRLTRLIDQIDKVERNSRIQIGALKPPPTMNK